MKKFGIIIGVFALVFIVASLVVTKLVYDQSFPRFERHDDTLNAALRYEDIEGAYERTLVSFPSGDNQLQGYVYHQEDALGLIVFAHGLGGGADSYLAYTKWFLDQGWSVFMYDATGSFDSEGESTKGFPQSLIDLHAALDYVKEYEDFFDLDLMLFGHSWGGYAVANALHLDDDIKAVVSVSAPFHANAMIFEQTQKMMGIFAYTQYPFLSLYQRWLFNDYASFNAIDAINQSDAHVMVIHGVNDDVIDYSGSAIMAKRDSITNPNVIFVSIEGEGRDGHNNVFRSSVAVQYFEELNIEYRALYDEHNGSIPYEINRDFYARVNRFLAQELDETLMLDIHAMFLQALTIEVE